MSYIINNKSFTALRRHSREIFISTLISIPGIGVSLFSLVNGEYRAAGVAACGLVAAQAYDAITTRRFNSLGNNLDDKLAGARR